MNAPWSDNFWPDPLWQLMTNLGMLVALVALIGAIGYLWKRGPALLIKYGFDWMSAIGHRWNDRRDR